MLGWSFSFLRHMISSSDNSIIFPPYVVGGLVVASLNMLMNVFLSLIFGDKSVPKIGGKR